MNGTVMAGMALAVALAMPLAGCASSERGKLTSAKLCAYAGGHYFAQAHRCENVAQGGRTAFSMCQAGGGFYDPTSDTCEWGKK
jgi:hypothetical protein